MKRRVNVYRGINNKKKQSNFITIDWIFTYIDIYKSYYSFSQFTYRLNFQVLIIHWNDSIYSAKKNFAIESN